MHTLSTLFPAAFPALALSHFVALLSPGPDFFLLVGYAVRYRIRGSIGLCLGIAAGNALYIVLAIVGWGLLRQAPLLFLLIELLGAGYLLWIGSLLIRSRPATLAMESVRAARPGFGRQLLLGLGSSLLNPKNALFYLALMTSLLGPAVTRLRAGDPIADVGYQAGFADQSHFHKTFVSYTAATPRQYAQSRSISDNK